MPLPQQAAQDDTLSELLQLINRQLTEKGLKVGKASAVNAHEYKHLPSLLEGLDRGTTVYAGKGCDCLGIRVLRGRSRATVCE